MRKALLTMLDMQHRMNSRVHEDWINQNFEWYRAAWIECGELIEHYGYKWWKKQQPDLAQVQQDIRPAAVPQQLRDAVGDVALGDAVQGQGHAGIETNFRRANGDAAIIYMLLRGPDCIQGRAGNRVGVVGEMRGIQLP